MLPHPSFREKRAAASYPSTSAEGLPAVARQPAGAALPRRRSGRRERGPPQLPAGRARARAGRLSSLLGGGYFPSGQVAGARYRLSGHARPPGRVAGGRRRRRGRRQLSGAGLADRRRRSVIRPVGVSSVAELDERVLSLSVRAHWNAPESHTRGRQPWADPVGKRHPAARQRGDRHRKRRVPALPR